MKIKMDYLEQSILPETQEFIQLFNLNSKEEIVPWKDRQYIGFSVIKNYPNSISFIPTKNKKGIKDSVILIKVGYSLKESQESKEKKAILSVEIHKSSRYQFKH
ncbi:MAG: hypothetical protein COU64_00840 [Candidatus Pacebacteria bacterium CG10_big_fil_rev_8_21_14_0_10_40_26]|nr:MAG: hypothetical protein COU64_00840 [Candidatus Pacebacteria bacterium CG10_big_fil_rev_8_21_14_0_10_40_26]